MNRPPALDRHPRNTERVKGEGPQRSLRCKEKLHKALAGQLTRWRERRPLADTRRRCPGSPAAPALSVYSGPWGGSDWLGLLWGIPIGQSSRHHPPAVVFGSAPQVLVQSATQAGNCAAVLWKGPTLRLCNPENCCYLALSPPLVPG